MLCPMKFLHIQGQGNYQDMECEREECAWWSYVYLPPPNDKGPIYMCALKLIAQKQ